VSRDQTTVRPEAIGDHDAIRDVVTRAFGRSDEARLVDALRQRADFLSELSLIATCEGCVVGHVLFSPIRILTAAGAIAALALAPLAVHPQVQNQGIGMQLVREGLEVCRRLGHTIVIVLGHASYYPRFGFVPARNFGIQAPFPLDEDAFMVLPLIPGALEGCSGTVDYPPEFATV
jgi:putative acetyltransferase